MTGVDLPGIRRQVAFTDGPMLTMRKETVLALVTAAEALVELEQRGYFAADSPLQNAARAAVEILRGAR